MNKNIRYVRWEKFHRLSEWRVTRLRALSRDSYRCQEIGCDFHSPTGMGLMVHHVQPRYSRPDLQFDMGNLMTLCDLHHQARHCWLTQFPLAAAANEDQLELPFDAPLVRHLAP